MLKRLSFTAMALSAALATVASAELPAEKPVASTPGVAIQQAVVGFDELARREALGPAPEKSHKVLRWPQPVPRDLPVPDEALLGSKIIPDNVLQGGPGSASSSVLSPPTTFNFAALGDNNTRIPPDVNGAAGVCHLMTTLNSQVRIQNRSGGIISTVSLQTFWSPVGPFVGLGVFDPKVLYDPYNNRWITTAVTDRDVATASLLIAVSQTSDPTGLWNFYRVDVDAANAVWADYPSIGFNKDWICVQVNMYNNGAGTFNRTHIYCFDKANLYAGGAGLFALISNAAIGGTQAPAITYDNAIATLYVLQTWNGNSGCCGFLRLYTITGPVAAPVLTPVSFPSVVAPWDYCPFPPGCAGDFAPQMGSAALIANGDDRMLKVIYRNGSLWGTHTVFLPAGTPSRSSVQWWQLNVAGGVMQFGRIDDGVPPLTFYAYPSLAVNKNNDMLIGYSRFSAGQFASANYSYRASTDPLNTLQPDVVLKVGEAAYNKTFGGPSNRWGDYSNTQVDPIDDKALWTIQEYAATPANDWGTWWGRLGYVAGDINDDGSFSAADVVAELNCCIGGTGCTRPFPSMYDMNCDCACTTGDIVTLLNFVYLGILPPC